MFLVGSARPGCGPRRVLHNGDKVPDRRDSLFRSEANNGRSADDPGRARGERLADMGGRRNSKPEHGGRRLEGAKRLEQKAVVELERTALTGYAGAGHAISVARAKS